jgi:hypothetical protein
MIEKVDSTSTTSIQPVFDFNATHNGVNCIASLNPADKGTERQFWFTIAMLATIYNVDRTTIQRRIETLINTGDIDDVQNCTSSQMPYSNGSLHETTLYDLTVFNKLGMTFIDNPRAVEIRNKFNDVIIKAETQPALPQSYLEALKALVAAEEAKEAAQKALEAEKEQHEADNRDFCEGLAILESKKAEIGSRREAKAMSKAAVAVKQCKKLESRVADLEDELGRGRNWMYINLLKDRWIKRFGHKPDWRLLKAYCDQIGIAPIKDVEGVFVDAKGGQHPTKMYRYPIAAWKMYYEWEMSLMQSLS